MSDKVERKAGSHRGKQRGENLVTMSVTIPQADLAAIDMIVLKRKLTTRDYNRSALVGSIVAEFLLNQGES